MEHAHTHTHTHTQSYIHIRICICVKYALHIHTYTYIHTYIRTHISPRVPRHLVELDGKEEADGRRDFAGMLPHQVEEDQLLQVHVRDGGGGEFEVEQTDDFHHLGFE